MSAPGRRRDDPPTTSAEVGGDEPGEARVASELEAIAAASARAVTSPPAASAAAATQTLGLARASRVVEGGVEVDGPGGLVVAALDRSVHPDVVATACERGELLLVAVERDRLTVVGALRTQPTPGVDAMDTIRLEARRVEIVGGESIEVRSGMAALAVRAVGEIETYADRIVSRAEEVQKIIGRMLRLN